MSKHYEVILVHATNPNWTSGALKFYRSPLTASWCYYWQAVQQAPLGTRFYPPLACPDKCQKPSIRRLFIVDEAQKESNFKGWSSCLSLPTVLGRPSQAVYGDIEHCSPARRSIGNLLNATRWPVREQGWDLTGW